MMNTFTDISIESLPESRTRVTATIPLAEVEKHIPQALSELKESVKMDGFRPGTAPDDLARKQIGEAKIFEEAALIAVSQAYGPLLIEKKIEALGRPAIVFTKLAPGNDAAVTIETDLVPTITLPDYAKIAKDTFGSAENTEITDADIEKTLKELQKMRAHQKMHEEEIDHDSHDHNDISDDSLPPLDDEFAKSIGDFATLEDLKVRIRENMQNEQAGKAEQMARAKFLETLRSEVTIELPRSLVAGELSQMMAQMSHDLAMAGQDLDEYLKAIGKTKDELETDWKEHAKARVTNHLILEELSRTESIEPSEEDIEAEATQLMETFASAPDISESRVRAYVTETLRNKMLFEKLEAMGKK